MSFQIGLFPKYDIFLIKVSTVIQKISGKRSM